MKKMLAVTWLTLAPTFALAHEGHTDSFLSAAIHPILGWDHLLAMILVGILAQQSLCQKGAHPNHDGGRAILLPMTFMASTTLGLFAGHHLELGQIPFEFGIASSVFVLGTAVALPQIHRSKLMLMPLIILFGLSHGFAHGIELVGPSLNLAMGMLVGTAALHVTGFVFAVRMSTLPLIPRSAGLLSVFAALWATIGA
jgi:urease accessory protein